MKFSYMCCLQNFVRWTRYRWWYRVGAFFNPGHQYIEKFENESFRQHWWCYLSKVFPVLFSADINFNLWYTHVVQIEYTSLNFWCKKTAVEKFDHFECARIWIQSSMCHCPICKKSIFLILTNPIFVKTLRAMLQMIQPLVSKSFSTRKSSVFQMQVSKRA